MLTEFKYTPAMSKIRKMRKRIRKIPGGTSAGKTYCIIAQLIQYATIHENLEISVVSHSVPHLKKGAIRDFLKILKMTGRYDDSSWNRSSLTYTFLNGSYIEFFSAEQEDKVRGPRRDILYVNECNKLMFETYNQLQIRTNNLIFIDYNPSITFWADTELKDDPDVETLVLTYKDNTALSKQIVKDLEKARDKARTSKWWKNWCDVYLDGKTGKLEGAIFDNWSKIDHIPSDAKLQGYGIDFGYSNDPTAIVAVYKLTDGKYLYHEIAYGTGLSDKKIAEILKKNGVSRSTKVVAEYANGGDKSIDEINSYGFSLIPCFKGQGSVNFGISHMQEEPFYVTHTSVNLIKELETYAWDTDKEGNKTNDPIDAFNHAIDAIRYFFSRVLTNSTKRKGLKRRN